MPHSSIHKTAREQLAGLASGAFTSLELLDAHVSRHQKLHAQINAIVATDLQRARQDAETIDRARKTGAAMGPLAGLPMTVKDGLDVEGMPARSGNPALLARPKTCADAAVVARARAAGAVIWGKSNVPFMLGDFQTFNDFDGTTNNPYDVTRTSGGSSGGSAAALATCMTPLEIGSDIGGSLRHPANFCGVVSLKPTYGLLPFGGHVPPLPSRGGVMDLNVVGPMARTIGDLRLLFAVLSAQAAPPRFTGPFKAAKWVDEPGFPLAREVRAAVTRAGDTAVAAGASIVSRRLPFSGYELIHAYLRILVDEMSKDDDSVRRQTKSVRPLALALGLVDRRVWSPWMVVKAATAPRAEIDAAKSSRDRMKAALAKFFESVDVIIAPVTPLAAFKHDHGPILQRSRQIDGKSWLETSCVSWISLATALHLPAVTIQAGRTTSGLPVGIQLIGPWNSEFKLLDIAERLEAGLGGFTPPSL